MLVATIPAAVALMIAVPIAFGFALTRRLATPASLLFWGGAIFLLSQALRLPFLQGLTDLFASGALPPIDPAYQVAFSVSVLALTAGLFEETARYLAYRHFVPQARSWNAAVTLGAGHGGAESAILGGLMGLEYATMLTLGTPGATTGSGAEQAQIADAAARYWATPWYVPLLGALERVFSICFHIAMAVVVLQAVTRKNLLWLLAAIVAHAAINAIGVLTLATYGPVAAEIALGLIAVTALFVVFHLRDRPSPQDTVK